MAASVVVIQRCGLSGRTAPLNAQLNVVVGFNKVYNYRHRLKGNLL
jgi:hypothetical protein